MSDTVPAQPQPSALGMLLGLPLIGGYLAFAVAVVPLLILAFLFDGELGGGFFILASIISAFWLMFLEGVARVRLTTPHLPIPLLWLTPIVFIVGVVKLF